MTFAQSVLLSLKYSMPSQMTAAGLLRQFPNMLLFSALFTNPLASVEFQIFFVISVKERNLHSHLVASFLSS
jgi:hypothetical protein